MLCATLSVPSTGQDNTIQIKSNINLYSAICHKQIRGDLWQWQDDKLFSVSYRKQFRLLSLHLEVLASSACLRLSFISAGMERTAAWRALCRCSSRACVRALEIFRATSASSSVCMLQLACHNNNNNKVNVDNRLHPDCRILINSTKYYDVQLVSPPGELLLNITMHLILAYWSHSM